MWHKGDSSYNTAAGLGIKNNNRSTAVEDALADFGSEHSFDEAAAMFERHYKFKVSDTTIRKITESYGSAAERFIQDKLEKYVEADEKSSAPTRQLEKIFLGFDGCSIRTGTLESIEPNSGTPMLLKTPSGRLKCKRIEEWRDVRLGFAKEPHENARKWFVGGMKDFPTLVKDLFNLCLGMGMNEKTKPVATSDGGNGLYEELDRQFCELQFILDYYHFKEHLYDTAKEMGLNEKTKDTWVREKESLAWEGRITDLIQSLQAEYEKTEVDRIRRLIGYITRFKNSISYKSFKEAGLSIGSGEIESAHKYITQKRLKLPGACWRPENVNPMLALRIIKANEWWEEFLNWELGIAA
jgi:hypothetical protein